MGDFKSQAHVFTISEVAADWHKVVIAQRIMRQYVVRACKQLDPRCNVLTCYLPTQSASDL